MRESLNAALQAATLRQDRRRLNTLRLITAAIRDRDIAAGAAGRERLSDDEVAEILAKMIRQRLESARSYEEAGRLEAAEQERQEIGILRELLPPQLSEQEMRSVCSRAIAETGAQGLRDVGRCMQALKARYPGQMDFGKASRIVKDQLS